MTHKLSRRTLLQSAGSGVMAVALSNGGRWDSAIAQTAVDGSNTFANSIGMEFLTIPAGRFMMGSPPTDSEARDFEKPQHQVTISRPFLLGRVEVTQANWEAILGENPYQRDRSNPYYTLPGMSERITHPHHPATVSWNDAQEFIGALNEKEAGSLYRLPTEAEWEYAARAGTTTRYSFGDDERALESHAWYGGDFKTGGHHPVGLKEPNPWGLHDMHGNVWEWVSDWYDPHYYAHSPAVDPQGPKTGTERVVRGGSWHTTATSWRTAFRRDYKPDYRGISIGFRLVREIA
ncbi:formylglycine-generating enzyme family protein [Agrobacterium fabrum]|uniref:formylglycine-generating enzyme family protein n=1 Tax=Agrobacterium fabrum TaxID=1176649 RepID=UPI0021586631|nr:formylglycine-generating enzyme family protein [Agrobacterium fabrum]MCR6727733.1 formylglycine-generating enzyme family protein [Agrobacterium fabrum]